MGAKITFDLSAGRIVIEGSEAELIKILQEAKAIAPHFKNIEIRSELSAVGTPSVIGGGQPVGTTQGRKSTVREFAKALPVNNVYERIASIAYHVIKHEGRASFAPKEMEEWFGLCGFQKPGNMRVALTDAKRRYGYINKKGRGQWTIATGGENIILEMLERHRGTA